MTITRKALSKAVATALLPAAMVAAIPAQAVIEIGDTEWTGYVRQHIGINLDDPNDNVSATLGGANSKLANNDDRGEISMMRTTVLLQGRGKIGDVARWTLIGRTSYEDRTDYLQDVENNYVGTTTGGPGNWNAFGLEFPFTNGIDTRDVYEEDSQLREAYVDFSTGRVDWRIGKQQVVWGETDVFHPNDVIHGYDFTWHSLFEPENEEVREPLWLIVPTIDFTDELGGSLQIVYRPGWDKEDAVGNTYDFTGGRWAQNGARGTNFLNFVPIDFENKEGSYDDENYGFRWDGTAGENEDITYSFNYYKGVSLDPVIITNGTIADAFGPNASHNFVYQEVETFGASLSGYIAAVDAVYRLEISHTPDKLFGNLADANDYDQGYGSYGITNNYDVTTLTIGYDTNARLMNLIGTSSPSLVSLQLFDTHIHNYDRCNAPVSSSGGAPNAGAIAAAACGSKEALINAFGGVHEEDTWIGTIKFTMPYMNDTLTVDLTGLWDFSDGGAMLLPSVEKQFGPHWRVRVEANVFHGGNKGQAVTRDNNGMSVVGSFENADTLITRITYQF